jgi:hypothetical protein
LITLEKKGNTARITIPEEKWKMLDITSVDYLIRVPVELMVDLNSNNGDLDVNGIVGEIALNTDNGDVSCMDVKGDATVKTQNGEIIAVGTSKNFEGETLNGNVDIEGFESVIVETKNGDMEFSNCGFVEGVTNHGDINIMSVRQFDLLTSLGDITIETKELEGESNADTKLGDIKITLSTFKSISADVSSAGDILLSGIEVSASEKEKMQDASSITLKSGGEGVLELNSKMGDISIIKE